MMNIVVKPQIVKYFFTDTYLIATSLMIFLIFMLMFLTYKLDLRTKRGFFAELIYEVPHFIGTLFLDNKVKLHIPLIAALMFYIFFSNILGAFPIPLIKLNGSFHIVDIKSPTVDLNLTVALATFVFFYVMIASIRSKGFLGYLKSFIQPLPFLLPLNIIGEMAKPFSLSMRLFGNIFSGALIMSLAYKYVPIILPVFLHLYFDFFAGAIQSVIFTSLTCVYIAFAT